MQAEASANLKKLLEIEKRLFLSTEDLKIQHAKSVQVCKVGTMLFPSFFPNTFNLFSRENTKIWVANWRRGLWEGGPNDECCGRRGAHFFLQFCNVIL